MLKKSRIVLALFFITMILYFTSDFQLVDIEKTAIIAAIGIDYVDEENISVTAQIAIPQATDQSATNSDAIITAKGKTLFNALDKIALETGWHPKLTFCNLIVFGREMLSHNFMPLVDFMLTSDRFQNSAVLAGAEKTAKEVLSSSTPLDYISSFALQKILLKNLDKSSPVLVTDIREFTLNSRSPSKFAFLPLIKVIKTEDKEKGDKAQSQSEINDLYGDNNIDKNVIFVDKKEEEGNNLKGDNNSSTVFDASSTIVFESGKPVATLNSQQTHCYNLLFKNVRESFIPVTFKKQGQMIDAIVTIVKNKSKINIDINNGIPTLNIKLLLVCEKEETYKSEEISSLKNPTKVSNEALDALEKKVKENIESTLLISRENNCDFFKIRDKLYQSHYKYYNILEKNILKNIKTNVEITCKNYR